MAQLQHWPLVAVLLGGLTLSFGALAADSAKAAHTRVSLIADVAMVKPGDSFRVGIRLQPEKGWHTYWQNPGDAGMSPTVEWQLPDGVTVGAIDWPTPAIFQMGPILTYAYPGEVIHVATVTVAADFSGESIPLKAELSWLACDEGNCVPGDAELEVAVPMGKRSIRKIAESAMMNRRALPQAVPAGWQLAVKSEKAYLVLSVATTAKIPATTRVMIVEEGVVEPGAPQKWVKRGDRYEVKLKRGSAPVPARLQGLLLLGEGEGRSFTIDF